MYKLITLGHGNVKIGRPIQKSGADMSVITSIDFDINLKVRFVKCSCKDQWFCCGIQRWILKVNTMN